MEQLQTSSKFLEKLRLKAINLKLIMTRSQWQYLEARSHPWKKQLWFKGKRLRPYAVWMTMQVEKMTVEAAAENWGLPLAAINEAIAYCTASSELLEREALEEKRRLEAKGYSLGSKIAN